MAICPKCQEEVEIETIGEVDDLGVVDILPYLGKDEIIEIHNILVEYECLSCGEVFTSTVTRAILKEREK